MIKTTVAVAMSGGVDSSVAACLLKRQGHEVFGLTMCFGLSESARRKPACCGMQGIEDARRVCHKLGIRHYALNMHKDLERWVIRDFCQEYLKGRTPNPCIRCNQYLKFDVLLKKALSLGAEYLATGHYARIVKDGWGQETRGEYLLKKAKDKLKDQSYFLYRLNQEQLRHILFPLGNYTKVQVRVLAKRYKLAVADKPASQEICFLPEDNYRIFLQHRFPAKRPAEKPGGIIDKLGNVLGKHKGISFYTVGQREGLGIALGYPAYITKIDPENNRITIGRINDCKTRAFTVTHPHFILSPKKKKIYLKVKIRYNHKEAIGKVLPFGHKIKVCFRNPQFAITPGQSAVFYDRDTVLGGGIIDEVLGGPNTPRRCVGV
ncbi:MAG: tRNA 2-thiouridine(34) synthase MnmA [Candidatus Omnitrophota bacterium]